MIVSLARSAKKTRHDEKQARKKRRTKGASKGATKKQKKSRFVDFFEAEEFWNDHKEDDKEDPKSAEPMEISSESSDHSDHSDHSDASSISFHGVHESWNGCSYWEENFPTQYTKDSSRSSRSKSKPMTGRISLVILTNI